MLHPKGILLKLEDYAGYYVRTKTTCSRVGGYILSARQEVCYLMNPQKRSRRILSSMVYRNYRQLKEALRLPEMTEQEIPLFSGDR